MPEVEVAPFEVCGFSILKQVVGEAHLQELRERLTVPAHRGGLRDAGNDSVVNEFAWSTGRELARGVLGLGARPVRILFFDKQPGANWALAYHQDLTIAVAEGAEVPGYRGWSVKQDVAHVRPPEEILKGMVAVRLHLDACHEDNGPLRVIPGSHRHGILSETAKRQRLASASDFERALTVESGDVILMHPLLLHASSPAKSPAHRRVLHVEYAGSDLPAPLRWALSQPA